MADNTKTKKKEIDSGQTEGKNELIKAIRPPEPWDTKSEGGKKKNR